VAVSPRFNRGIILADQGGHVTISELVRVHACPVRFYYEKNEPVTESDRYAICKQISYHLGNTLEADAIWDEVLTVRPATDPALREFLDVCIASCRKHDWKPAAQTDVTVVSQKQGIAGQIDRMAEDGTFSIVRAAGAMLFGTYVSDRLRIAGIAFCLEEMTGKEVEGGHVEYIPDGISRYHAVQPRDRRQLLTTLHKLRAIHRGEAPVHPLNAPCNRCKYKERCDESGGHRLSELL
jgi:CRISPR-associated exonuclease Cas4